MELDGRHSSGETSSTKFYTGNHRNLNMIRGVGHIPLGDRGRDTPEFNSEFGRERNSIDKYTKYTIEP